MRNGSNTGEEPGHVLEISEELDLVMEMNGMLDTPAERAQPESSNVALLARAGEFGAIREFRVDARDETGQSALHWAALTGDLDLAKGLLAHRADPDAKAASIHLSLFKSCHRALFMTRGENIFEMCRHFFLPNLQT